MDAELLHIHERIDSVVRDLTALVAPDLTALDQCLAAVQRLDDRLDRVTALQSADAKRLERQILDGHSHAAYAHVEHPHAYAPLTHPHAYAEVVHSHSDLASSLQARQAELERLVAQDEARDTTVAEVRQRLFRQEELLSQVALEAQQGYRALEERARALENRETPPHPHAEHEALARLLQRLAEALQELRSQVEQARAGHATLALQVTEVYSAIEQMAARRASASGGLCTCGAPGVTGPCPVHGVAGRG